jgi:hypothetical protein
MVHISAKEEGGENLRQGLLRFMRNFTLTLASPPNETVGSYDYGSSRGDSVRVTKRIPSIDKISRIPVNPIDVQREM